MKRKLKTKKFFWFDAIREMVKVYVVIVAIISEREGESALERKHGKSLRLYVFLLLLHFTVTTVCVGV